MAKYTVIYESRSTEHILEFRGKQFVFRMEENKNGGIESVTTGLEDQVSLYFEDDPSIDDIKELVEQLWSAIHFEIEDILEELEDYE